MEVTTKNMKHDKSDGKKCQEASKPFRMVYTARPRPRPRDDHAGAPRTGPVGTPLPVRAVSVPEETASGVTCLMGETTLDRASPGGGGGARLIVGATFPAVGGVAIGDAFADSGEGGSTSEDRVVLTLGLPLSFLPRREAPGEVSSCHYNPMLLTFNVVLDVRWTFRFGATLLIVLRAPLTHLFAQEAMPGAIENVRDCVY